VGLRSCRADDSIWLSVWNNLAGSLILAGVIALTGESILPYRSSIPGLAVFGFLQMALPYTFFAKGLRTISPAQATLIALVEPILNPVWVWLLHDEQPHIATIIGGIFMIVGVVVANFKSKIAS
jgi:drug/metabolite transporter (DMT)-like permease